MPAPDSGDDFVGIGGPSEGARLCVVFSEEAVDRRLQIDDRARHAALQPALCQLGEEPFDCVQP